VLVCGANNTYLFGINDQNVMLGAYEDTAQGFTAHKYAYPYQCFASLHRLQTKDCDGSEVRFG
jgi:hypothetical protein